MKKINNDYTKELNEEVFDNGPEENNKKPLSKKTKFIILISVGLLSLASLIGMIFLILKYSGIL